MWNNCETLSLDRHIGSLNYIIPTIQILSLMKEVKKWLSMNDCGAIIYGRSRVGKTRAITYISEELRDNFGMELPIYVYCATDYPPTQKTFYSSLLTVMKHEEPHKGTAVQLRQRLVNRIIVNAVGTRHRRAVLFIDEAYLLTAKEYTWLIDIYNELYNNDILLTVFLFGSKSRFDDLCLAMITKLKERYPFIKRVYVRSMYPEIEKFYEKYILDSYDESYMPKGVEKAGRAAYVERNQAMIDGSDFCVFYYDENYRPEKRKSGTRIAYEYAKKKGKKIYNVYEG